MTLSNDTYEFIKGEVVFLFERYNVCTIPISGFELAYKMGIRLIPYSSLSVEKRQAAGRISSDGFFSEINDGIEVVFYNDSVQYERMNMTILHEIAHCVLDHTGSPERADVEEAEANFFAKYALAPPPLVHIISPNNWTNVRCAFHNSVEAALYSYAYYQKWLYGFRIYGYKKYEIELLRLFGIAPEKERNSPMVA